MDDVEVWLACKDEGKFKSEGEALKKRSEKLLQRYVVHELTFVEALHVSFMRYLTEAIVLVQQCYRLSDAIHHANQMPAHSEMNTVKGYVFHRDPLSAARTALGAFTIILSGCMVWISRHGLMAVRQYLSLAFVAHCLAASIRLPRIL